MQLPGQQRTLNDGSYIIGRDPGCNIVINDMTVSGRHAQLTINGRDARLFDLGSRNGTTVAGQRLQTGIAIPLPESAMVTFGTFSTTFTFSTGPVGGTVQAPGQPSSALQAAPVSPGYSPQAPARQNQPIGAPQQVVDGLPYKSYHGTAVLVLVLYWVLYLPGLIANIVFIHDANNYRRRTGQTAEGIGCLWALLWFFLLGPLCIGAVLAFAVFVLGISTL